MGQLAVDLLISSLRAERAGYLDDPYVLPCVGNDAYGPIPQGNLALPLEGPLSISLSHHLYVYLKPLLYGCLSFHLYQTLSLSVLTRLYQIARVCGDLH